MLRIASANLWRTIHKKAKESAHRRAAIAYVTDPRLLPLGHGDILVTDASNASIAAGRTSAAALAKYLKAGVELFNLPDLHAKVLVLDDWAIVGSANASQHSATVYFEAAVLSDRPELVSQSEKLVAFLAKSAAPIDAAFIRRISKIPVAVRRWALGTRPKRSAMPSLEPRYWFVSLQKEAPYPGDDDLIDRMSEDLRATIRSSAAATDWFWWPREAKFREGDIVIECVRSRAKVSTTRSIRVFEPGRIANVFQEEGVRARTFHCLWPAEPGVLSWSEFLKLAKRAGVSRKFLYNRSTELTAQEYSDLSQKWPRVTG